MNDDHSMSYKNDFEGNPIDVSKCEGVSSLKNERKKCHSFCDSWKKKFDWIENKNGRAFARYV